MPTTKNELRDCCRNNVPPLVNMHEDQILHVIRLKVEKGPKKQGAHIKFEPQISKQKVLKEEEKESIKDEPMVLEEGVELPSF